MVERAILYSLNIDTLKQMFETDIRDITQQEGKVTFHIILIAIYLKDEHSMFIARGLIFNKHLYWAVEGSLFCLLNLIISVNSKSAIFL